MEMTWYNVIFFEAYIPHNEVVVEFVGSSLDMEVVI